MNSQDKNRQSSNQAGPASGHTDIPGQAPAQTGQVSQERGPEPAPLTHNHTQPADSNQPKVGASSSLWWPDDEKTKSDAHRSPPISSASKQPHPVIKGLKIGLRATRQLAIRILAGAFRPVLQKIVQIYYQKFYRF